eukprot:gene5372-6518_t
MGRLAKLKVAAGEVFEYTATPVVRSLKHKRIDIVSQGFFNLWISLEDDFFFLVFILVPDKIFVDADEVAEDSPPTYRWKIDAELLWSLDVGYEGESAVTRQLSYTFCSKRPGSNPKLKLDFESPGGISAQTFQHLLDFLRKKNGSNERMLWEVEDEIKEVDETCEGSSCTPETSTPEKSLQESLGSLRLDHTGET